MKTKSNELRDYIKANRRASREAEIEDHNRPASFSRVHKSKKVYDRKRVKADDKRHLPSSFLYKGKQAGRQGQPKCSANRLYAPPAAK